MPRALTRWDLNGAQNEMPDMAKYHRCEEGLSCCHIGLLPDRTLRAIGC
jgi:hypothetical protein